MFYRCIQQNAFFGEGIRLTFHISKKVFRKKLVAWYTTRVTRSYPTVEGLQELCKYEYCRRFTQNEKHFSVKHCKWKQDFTIRFNNPVLPAHVLPATPKRSTPFWCILQVFSRTGPPRREDCLTQESISVFIFRSFDSARDFIQFSLSTQMYFGQTSKRRTNNILTTRSAMEREITPHYLPVTHSAIAWCKTIVLRGCRW